MTLKNTSCCTTKVDKSRLVSYMKPTAADQTWTGTASDWKENPNLLEAARAVGGYLAAARAAKGLNMIKQGIDGHMSTDNDWSQ